MKLTTALLALLLATPALAEWSLEDQNKTIEQTNFIVDGQCSGTLIDLERKLVLTNFHCIENKISVVEEEITNDEGFVKKMKKKRYRSVPVQQDKYDGFTRTSSSTYVSEIVAENVKQDLAVLQIQGEIPHTYASPLLPEGEKVIRGEDIFTVGNPAMWENSIFKGVVSNVNRTFTFPWTNGERTPMIQFSGGIVGGNSGGALYNNRGQIIGIPSAGMAGVLGLAIPVSTTVRPFLKNNCLMTKDDAACKAEKAKKEIKEKKTDE